MQAAVVFADELVSVESMLRCAFPLFPADARRVYVARLCQVVPGLLEAFQAEVAQKSVAAAPLHSMAVLPRRFSSRAAEQTDRDPSPRIVEGLVGTGCGARQQRPHCDARRGAFLRDRWEKIPYELRELMEERELVESLLEPSDLAVIKRSHAPHDEAGTKRRKLPI